MISHVKFVSIPTRDQDRALAFWTERVGFRVLTDQPFDDKQRWIELRIGSSDTRLVLFMFDAEGLQPGALFNGALACDNVQLIAAWAPRSAASPSWAAHAWKSS